MSTNGLEPPLLPPARATRLKLLVPAIAVGAVVLVAAIGFLLRHHAASGVNKVALAASPKDVTVVRAKSASYRPEHRFVGTLRPWVEAKVGPQFLSAYISTVLVRPGASVRRGQILGTLDCRDASARSHSISLEARALQALDHHEPVRPVGIDQDVVPRRLDEKGGMPDPGDCDLT